MNQVREPGASSHDNIHRNELYFTDLQNVAPNYMISSDVYVL